MTGMTDSEQQSGPFLEVDSGQIAWITFDDPGRRLNVLDESVMLRLSAAARRGRSAPGQRIRSGGRDSQRQDREFHRRCGHRGHRGHRRRRRRARDRADRAGRLPEGRRPLRYPPWRRSTGSAWAEGSSWRWPATFGSVLIASIDQDRAPRGAAGHSARLGRHHAAPSTHRPPSRPGPSTHGQEVGQPSGPEARLFRRCAPGRDVLLRSGGRMPS